MTRALTASLLMLTLLGCGKTDPTYQYLMDKSLVIVVEVQGAITDVRLLDAFPADEIAFENDKGVSVLVFGTKVKGYPEGARASGNKVTVWAKDGKDIVLFGNSLQYHVKVDNKTLAGIHAFLSVKKTGETKP